MSVHKTDQPASVPDFISALKQCSKSKDLERGKSLHSHAISTGFHRDKYVATALITMYGKCKCMERAEDVFHKVAQPGVFSWNSLMLGYVENGESLSAIELFQTMDCQPNAVTFLAALKACSILAAEGTSEKQRWLKKGVAFHEQLKAFGLESNIFLSNSLIDMYGKFGSMSRARKVFDRMSSRTVVSWTSLILGYTDNGESFEAIHLFTRMDCEPDYVTFLAALKACSNIAATGRASEKQFGLANGVLIHDRLKKLGLDSNVLVSNTLVDMYCKCGSVSQARDVFEKTVSRDAVTWNCLIHGYVESCESLAALELFRRMNCEPSSVTFVAALKACADLGAVSESEKPTWLGEGRRIHKEVKDRGLESNLVIATTLVDLYSKCGSMFHARDVFDRMERPNVITWNCLLLGYVRNGESLTAVELFGRMDVEPDCGAFVAALMACADLAGGQERMWLEKGLEFHKQLKERGFEAELQVGNTLIDMYSKCRSMEHARDVFDRMSSRDVVSWNCLLQGYVENGESFMVMELLASMDCQPNHLTYVSLLKACASLAKAKEEEAKRTVWLYKGLSIHRRLAQQGLESNALVANSLLDMYSKCGGMRHARDVFEKMPERTAVSWNTLLLGYVESGESSTVIELFLSMDCEPDAVTFAAALKASGSLSEVELGRYLHARVCRLGLEDDELVGNRLVDFYGKCGDVSAAKEVFDGINSPGIVSWNSLLAGYSFVGDTSQVFRTAGEIHEAGVEADGVTFVCILTACSHAGEVKEGRRVFESMCRYGVRPSLEHYNCLVDMLSRANRLHEALQIIRDLPFETNDVIWTSLLKQLRIYDV